MHRCLMHRISLSFYGNLSEFKDGKLNGEGNVNFNDGTKFVGNFAENKKYGKGTYVWKDGDIYKGNWENNNLYDNNIITEPTQGTFRTLSVGLLRQNKSSSSTSPRYHASNPPESSFGLSSHSAISAVCMGKSKSLSGICP